MFWFFSSAWENWLGDLLDGFVSNTVIRAVWALGIAFMHGGLEQVETFFAFRRGRTKHYTGNVQMDPCKTVV